jgi:hypothetical protein
MIAASYAVVAAVQIIAAAALAHLVLETRFSDVVRTANNQYRNKYSQKRNCAATFPIFHIHVSVSDLYIPTVDQP